MILNLLVGSSNDFIQSPLKKNNEKNKFKLRNCGTLPWWQKKAMIEVMQCKNFSGCPLCLVLSLSPCHLELVKEGWTTLNSSSSLIRHPDLKKYFYFRATQTFTIEFFMLDLDCLHTGLHRGPCFDLVK